APCPSWPTHELQPSCKMAPHRGPGRGCDEEDHHGSSGHCGSPAAGHGAEGRDTRPARVPHDAGRWRRRSRGPPPGDRPKENRRDDVGHRAEPGDARGRGDYLPGTGVNPQSWRTWDDLLRDLPKLNKPPQYYALTLAGIPFFVNEDVYMWAGANGGSVFDAKGQPALESPQIIGMLEFWKKLKPFLPPGWSSHDYLETLSAWATGKAASVLMWGRTTGYIDQYAPPDKRNPDIFQVWPKTVGPMGKAPLTQFDNEPWVIYADAPADEKAAAKEFLKFFFKPENYRRYCDSVPVHLLSIFKADFKDSSYLNHP